MSTSKKFIIVPIDFSEQSIIALKQSYNIARFSDSEILLLHVIDEDMLATLEYLFKDQPYEDPVKEQAKQRLDKLAREVEKETGLRLNTTVRKGKIYDEIVKLAEETGASFIIMGTHGAVGIKKKVMGSNAARVIKEANCPVITIKGKDHKSGCKKILLPLDLTKETKEKVVKAVELAQFFGSTIYVLSILETDDEFVINRLNRQMEQVRSYIINYNIDCVTEIIRGDDVPDSVLKYAEKIDADLIVIMTQQEINWVEMFIGFSAQEIINNSSIPVLSIRPTLRDLTPIVTY
ncbi:MAG: universal stress protein [Bacteroidia bacterium]|nr:universal stress protein [Bacteroidia bacterium]MCZ2277803.1 universal stress protein [Bacteroidia bacterium]